jgi:hypothetical protein
VKLNALRCHPSAINERIRRLEAGAHLGSTTLRLTYRLDADFDALRIPKETAFQRGNELWRHTCFEAFVRAKGEPAYLEFNFSPSREWAAYRFTAYRDGAVTPEEPVTQVNVTDDNGVLRLDALIRLDRLSPAPSRPLELGLSAVLEDRGGVSSFWALKHPMGRPDFHNADTFTLEL